MERAKRASRERHCARMVARAMMSCPDDVFALQIRDVYKYGNPNGPTFSDALGLARRKYPNVATAHGFVKKHTVRC